MAHPQVRSGMARPEHVPGVERRTAARSPLRDRRGDLGRGEGGAAPARPARGEVLARMRAGAGGPGGLGLLGGAVPAGDEGREDVLALGAAGDPGPEVREPRALARGRDRTDPDHVRVGRVEVERGRVLPDRTPLVARGADDHRPLAVDALQHELERPARRPGGVGRVHDQLRRRQGGEGEADVDHGRRAMLPQRARDRGLGRDRRVCDVVRDERGVVVGHGDPRPRAGPCDHAGDEVGVAREAVERTVAVGVALLARGGLPRERRADLARVPGVGRAGEPLPAVDGALDARLDRPIVDVAGVDDDDADRRGRGRRQAPRATVLLRRARWATVPVRRRDQDVVRRDVRRVDVPREEHPAGRPHDVRDVWVGLVARGPAQAPDVDVLARRRR